VVSGSVAAQSRHIDSQVVKEYTFVSFTKCTVIQLGQHHSAACLSFLPAFTATCSCYSKSTVHTHRAFIHTTPQAPVLCHAVLPGWSTPAQAAATPSPTPQFRLPLQTVTRTAHSPAVASGSLPLRVLVVLPKPLPLFALLLPSHVLSKRRVLPPAGMWFAEACIKLAAQAVQCVGVCGVVSCCLWSRRRHSSCCAPAAAWSCCRWSSTTPAAHIACLGQSSLTD
jgi:hypothetical protein